MQVAKELIAKEVAKKEDGDVKKVKDVSYDPKEFHMKTLVQAIGLTTTSYFSYNPTEDSVRSAYIKKHKLKDSDVPEESEKQSETLKTKLADHKEQMIKDELDSYFIKRNVEGDASETGLVKFAMPILMTKYGGDYEDGLDGIRKAFPVVKVGDNQDAIIPFNSSIKFNALIRDMNPSERKPATKEDNITMFMKGAPERVLERCQSILNGGKVERYGAAQQYSVKAANDRFGLMGERVLAFARVQLDP